MENDSTTRMESKDIVMMKSKNSATRMESSKVDFKNTILYSADGEWRIWRWIKIAVRATEVS